jgi:hypothetical protein
MDRCISDSEHMFISINRNFVDSENLRAGRAAISLSVSDLPLMTIRNLNVVGNDRLSGPKLGCIPLVFHLQPEGRVRPLTEGISVIYTRQDQSP